MANSNSNSQSTQAILKKIRRLELRTKRLVDDALIGQYHSVFKGRGMNFEDVRQYTPNDEIRFIDRNVTARTGELHVKQFTEEREMTVMLLVDVSASGNLGSSESSKRELAGEVAALLAFSAISNQDKVGLILFSEFNELYLPPKKGRSHVLRIIREVLFHKAEGRKTDIAQALDFLNRVAKRRAVVFLISDFQAPDFSKPLGTTSRIHDLVAVSVIDPLEEALPNVGRVTFEDSETGEQYEVDTASAATRMAFQNASQLRHQNLMTQFRKLNIDVVALHTNKDYVPALRGFFKTRERRLARR